MAVLMIRNDVIAFNPKLSAFVTPLYIPCVAVLAGTHTILPIPVIQ